MSRSCFLLFSLTALPAGAHAQSIPAPETVLGFPVGTDL